MYTRKMEEDLDCGIRLGMKVFGGKWKCCILDAINRGITRPADICRYIAEATPRVVEIQLAELLFFGAIGKCADEGYPKKTEYQLTPLGSTILPILTQIDEWGMRHATLIKERLSEWEEA